MLIELIGLLAGALILSATLPQLREAITNGAEGVSIGSWALFLACSAVWFGYGVQIGSPATIAANAAGVLAFGVLVIALLRLRGQRGAATLVAIPAAVVALAATALVAPAPLVGAAGVLLGFGLAVPQLVVSWRGRNEPSQVSVLSWAMVLAGQSLWLLYGLLLPDAAIIAVNIVTLSTGSAVLALAWRSHHRHGADGLAAAPAEAARRA